MLTRGRPKLIWKRVVRADIITCGLDRTLTEDRGAWKAAIRRHDSAAGG